MKEIDKIIVKMEKKLAKARKEYFNPKRPTNLLVEVRQQDLNRVASLWQLPADYLYFLGKYSPVLVEWDNDDYFSLNICGAQDLIDAQHGYAYNPITKKTIAEWPPNYLVIATSDGDPFCLDLALVNSPVFSAGHGTGQWDFEEDAPSFVHFLKRVIA
ncbi:MAG: SMI1/KNR4 family protein [Sporomusaceae bacterium]|nr:SMI1/KNR4 family protein [Sporomusaceae bacterium]